MYFVYVMHIKQTTWYKIGITDNLKRRLAGIQCANPEQVELLYYYTLDTQSDAKTFEVHMHGLYQQHRIAGEWFEIPDVEFANKLSGGTPCKMAVRRTLAHLRKVDKPAPSSKEDLVIDRAVRLLTENPSWKKRTLMDLKRETGIDHNTWSK